MSFRPLPPSHDRFPGGGEAGTLLRGYDWARSPIGSPDTWPSALTTLVRVMLNAGQPMFIAWGPSSISLYNDGYIPILGDKHPDALGRSMAEVWSERKSVADFYIDVRSGASLRFRAMMLLVAAMESLPRLRRKLRGREQLRRLYYRLRKLLPPA